MERPLHCLSAAAPFVLLFLSLPSPTSHFPPASSTPHPLSMASTSPHDLHIIAKWQAGARRLGPGQRHRDFIHVPSLGRGVPVARNSLREPFWLLQNSPASIFTTKIMRKGRWLDEDSASRVLDRFEMMVAPEALAKKFVLPALSSNPALILTDIPAALTNQQQSDRRLPRGKVELFAVSSRPPHAGQLRGHSRVLQARNWLPRPSLEVFQLRFSSAGVRRERTTSALHPSLDPTLEKNLPVDECENDPSTIHLPSGTLDRETTTIRLPNGTFDGDTTTTSTTVDRGSLATVTTGGAARRLLALPRRRRPTRSSRLLPDRHRGPFLLLRPRQGPGLRARIRSQRV